MKNTLSRRQLLAAGLSLTVLPQFLLAGASAATGEMALAPDFELPRIDGQGSVRLSDLRGEPVFLTFWASWCPNCRVEMPEIAKLSEHFKGRDVKFIGVSLDRRARDAQALWTAKNATLLLDAEGSTLRPYASNGIPLNVLVGADGRLANSSVGFSPDLVARASGWIDALLKS